MAEVTADTADGELKSSLGRRGGALLLAAASFSFSRHGLLSWVGDGDCARYFVMIFHAVVDVVAAVAFKPVLSMPTKPSNQCDAPEIRDEIKSQMDGAA